MSRAGDVLTINDEPFDFEPLPVGATLPAEAKFEQAREAKLSEINSAFNAAAAALTDGYPEAERTTWATQQKEALAWGADPAAPTPYLDGLAAARGILVEEMRQKTLDQTQLFMVASQQLVGTRQRLRDLAYDAKTQVELDGIKWSSAETT